MASVDNNEVSADLAGFVDSEADERERWARLEREALALLDPLARMIGHKEICDGTDVSKGQLSRELSPNYETRLSLRTALFVGRRTRNERLAQIVVCDGLGMRMPEWQRRKASPEEELRALKDECRQNGVAGQAILEGASLRVKAGR